MDDSIWLTVSIATSQFVVSESTLRRRVKEGKIRSKQISQGGRQILAVHRDDIETRYWPRDSSNSAATESTGSERPRRAVAIAALSGAAGGAAATLASQFVSWLRNVLNADNFTNADDLVLEFDEKYTDETAKMKFDHALRTMRDAAATTSLVYDVTHTALSLRERIDAARAATQNDAAASEPELIATLLHRLKQLRDETDQRREEATRTFERFEAEVLIVRTRLERQLRYCTQQKERALKARRKRRVRRHKRDIAWITEAIKRLDRGYSDGQNTHGKNLKRFDELIGVLDGAVADCTAKLASSE